MNFLFQLFWIPKALCRDMAIISCWVAKLPSPCHQRPWGCKDLPFLIPYLHTMAITISTTFRNKPGNSVSILGEQMNLPKFSRDVVHLIVLKRRGCPGSNNQPSVKDRTCLVFPHPSQGGLLSAPGPGLEVSPASLVYLQTSP